MAKDITYVGLGDMTFKEGPDGSMFVYGLATDDSLDMDRQRCDANWLKSAMPAWFQTGANVREQHSAIAAGVGLELSQEGTGWMLKSEVVDPVTQAKVRKGVLKGYSIGIKNAKVIKSDDAPNGLIAGGDIVEISLVDRPANYNAKIELAKAVNGDWTMTEIEKDSVSTEDIMQEAEMNEQGASENEPFEASLPCPECAGTGQVHTDDNVWHDCEKCGGSGKCAPEPIHESPSHPGADDLETAIELAVEGDTEKREFSDKEREEAADKGQAMPDGSFPIKTVADLKNAIQSIGRAKDPAKAKAHIKARAEALGKESLIPDNWKAVEGDVEKMEHDPAELAAVRESLIALIKAELDEMASGEEDEVCDVSDLLLSLQIFLNWWEHEADENETTAPFVSDNDASQGDDDMAYIGLGVSPDLIKSASSAEATDEIRAELRSEIVKALGLDDSTTKASLSEAKEEIELLKAELSAVKEMAVPGGPALRATQNQSFKSAQVDQLRAEASKFSRLASQVTDPALKAAYAEKARKIEHDADALQKSN
jgi:hypothetical protein